MLPRWLLVATVVLPAVVAGSAASFAQATSGESVAMSPVDQAVRTGDFGRAATLLRKLADAGNPEAQYRLASLYRTGRGVPQDDLLAFKWMKAAAEQNHGSAQFNLAKMYLSGRGVALDAAVAKVWLQKAASRGNDEAAKLLTEISAQRRIEPSAPKSIQAPSNGVARAPGKTETSSQPGSPKVSGDEREGVLEAAARGQTDALRKLISSGASISAKDDDGNTALLLAASRPVAPGRPQDSSHEPARPRGHPHRG
jgi:TPR repeat protein